jgi:hypothetical protein
LRAQLREVVRRRLADQTLRVCLAPPHHRGVVAFDETLLLPEVDHVARGAADATAAVDGAVCRLAGTYLAGVRGPFLLVLPP